MGHNQVSRPSDERIFNFVNSSEFLDLPKISYPGDVVYVIYQKTGFKNNLLLNIDTSYRFGNRTGEKNNRFSPTFFVWKLIFEEKQDIRPGNFYYITGDWPKIHRAETDDGKNNTNWNQPQNWSDYESWENI
jgi:hypothetical protein